LSETGEFELDRDGRFGPSNRRLGRVRAVL